MRLDFSPGFTILSKVTFLGVWTVGVKFYWCVPHLLLQDTHKDRHERASLLSIESLANDTISHLKQHHPCMMRQPDQASKQKQNVYEKSLPGKNFSVRISVKEGTLLFPLKVSKYSACQAKSDKLCNELSLKAANYTSLLLFYWEVFPCQLQQCWGSVSHWLGQQLPLQLPTHI